LNAKTNLFELAAPSPGCPRCFDEDAALAIALRHSC